MKLIQISECCDSPLDYKIEERNILKYLKFFHPHWLPGNTYGNDEVGKCNIGICKNCGKESRWTEHIHDVNAWRKYSFNHLTSDEKMAKFCCVF